VGTRLLQKAFYNALNFVTRALSIYMPWTAPRVILNRFLGYITKGLSKLSDRDLATVLVYKEGSFSFISLTNVWRPSKKYRIFDHHTAGLNLVGDRILLIQKINYTISTPLFSKGELN